MIVRVQVLYTLRSQTAVPPLEGVALVPAWTRRSRAAGSLSRRASPEHRSLVNRAIAVRDLTHDDDPTPPRSVRGRPAWNEVKPVYARFARGRISFLRTPVRTGLRGEFVGDRGGERARRNALLRKFLPKKKRPAMRALFILVSSIKPSCRSELWPVRRSYAVSEH